MIVEDKKPREGKEKEWEDPTDPNKPTDERDKEQLLRQYKEAKRRHDNLNEDDDQKDKTK
ncbi:hypothetical protein [Mucilaginibacter sp. dw_454]|uniref:hypothetical protein n=1 Tax=Mucilaginibacter sp. dw_454 TaxID=2720079 RepID=UPI001BD1E715|nr:hypothetical protein [Mucilaginibacter sp. dw_454]